MCGLIEICGYWEPEDEEKVKCKSWEPFKTSCKNFRRYDDPCIGDCGYTPALGCDDCKNNGDVA